MSEAQPEQDGVHQEGAQQADPGPPGPEPGSPGQARAEPPGEPPQAARGSGPGRRRPRRRVLPTWLGDGRRRRRGRHQAGAGHAAGRPTPADRGAPDGQGGDAAPAVAALAWSDPARRADRDRLLQEVRRQGARAGRSGQFDAWSFGGDPVPYLRYLAHDRERAVTEALIAAGRSQDELMQRHWRAVAEAKVAGRQAADLRERRQAAVRQMQTLHGQVDRLAIWEAWRRERRQDSAWPVAPPLLAGPPSDPARVGPEGDAEPAGGDQVAAGRFAAGARWEGAYAPRMSERWKWRIIAALGLVEIPIQFQIFQYFHDNDWGGLALTALFTLSVSLLMILLPHLAGRWYRIRHATGSDPLSRFVPLTLMVPWGVVAYVLGDLRRRVLLAPTVIEGEQVTQFNAVDILHLSPVTISVMFISLLVLTGGISFLLGLAHDHPLQAGYLGARNERDRLDRELGEAERAAEAAAAEVDHYPDRWVAMRVLGDEEARVVREIYAGAEAVYRDAVADAMGDPAVTEALTGTTTGEGTRGEAAANEADGQARDHQPGPAGP
jgi:hypothetical protein